MAGLQGEMNMAVLAIGKASRGQARLEQTPEERRAIFHGKLSRDYELFRLACPHYENLEQAVVDKIKARVRMMGQDSIRVLEIGTGTGLTTGKILDIDPRITIVSVDREIMMLKRAEAELPEQVIEGRLALRQADAMDFVRKQARDSFDIFASAWTLHNMDAGYRQKLIQQIFRVLRKGGFFVNGDKYGKDDPQKHKDDLAWQIRKLDVFKSAGRRELYEAWKAHYLGDDAPGIAMGERESLDMMKTVGFVDMAVSDRMKLEAVMVGNKPL